METKIILEEQILALTFNHERSSIIYLAQPAFQGENPINELIELDLHNKTVLERYIVSSQLPNQPPFTLLSSKRNGLLILAFQPCLMEIWKLGSGSPQGFNQSIWSGETKGKRGFEIGSADVSNLDGTLFFSAIGQRNIYCANIDDTIQNNSPQLNSSKLKLPLKVEVNDLKCHPHDQKVFAACSDSQIHIWNTNTFTELIGITQDSICTALAFQQDGQKLLCGCEDGKILCWDGKTLGSRNILLAVYKAQDPQGQLCIHWLNYNGAQNSDDFLSYQVDGSINLMNIKLLVPQEMIREQKVSRTKKQELFGNIEKVSTILQVKNESRGVRVQYQNLGLSKFLQVHQYSNFISISQYKVTTDSQVYVGQLYYQFSTQILLLNNNNNLLVEYPVCSPQYSYKFKQLLPDYNNKILTQRHLYFIDQHSLELKQYCLGKGMLKSIVNLTQLILGDHVIYRQLNIRPNSLNYTKNIQFLISYKMQSKFRCCTVMFNQETGVLSDNVKEYPSIISLYLGPQNWSNPPLFLLYDDRQSYSLIFEDSLPQEEEFQQMLSQADHDRLSSCMKQSLNLKVSKLFWTPIRQGFVILYQPMNENTLRFSRNRNPDANLTDLLMQSGQEMVFRMGLDDQITDVTWQNNDDYYVGAIVTILNVFIVNDSLMTLRVISLQPQINYNNRILLTYWLGHALIVQSKFHVLYVLMNGKCGSIQSIDNYEEKNLLSVLLWDRAVLLSSKYQKNNLIEIKTKSINLLQPILQGYLQYLLFFKLGIDQSVVQILLQSFGDPNIDFSLIQDLEEVQLRHCSKFAIGMDDCKQFTKRQKLKYYLNTLDDEMILETLFDQNQIIDNFDLQQQLIKKIQDPRHEYLKELLQMAQNYFSLQFQYKLASIINAILQDEPNFIVNILAKQDKLLVLSKVDGRQNQQLYELLSKQQQNIGMEQINPNLILADAISSNNQSFVIKNLQKIITKLEEQKDIISNKLQSDPNMELQPSYYFTDYLLDKLKLIQVDLQKKPLPKSNVGFGEDKYHLVYEDFPNEDDDEDNIINGKITRYFEKLSFDSIVFFLGVGGQPQVRTFQQAQKIEQNQVQQEQQEELDFGDDDEAKEFQDLLIYWRIDEGKGNILEDLGNYEHHADIYVKGEIAQDTDELWEKLEDSEPMEQEDKWGKKCEAQWGFQLNDGIGFQTKKKNYWKRRKLEFFTFEIWIKPQAGDGQLLEVGDEALKILLIDYQLNMSFKDQSVSFSVEQNEDNVVEPVLKQNQWNHLCIGYEAAQNQISIYLNAKYQFVSNEIELPQELFRDNYLVLGETKKAVKVLQCQITEFRFWKQKFSINEIRDGYRTPLAIVSEKKKQLKMKFKEKKEQKIGDLKQFIGMMGFDQIEQVEESSQAQDQNELEIQQGDLQQQEMQQSQSELQQFEQFGGNNDLGFNEFAQFSQSTTQQQQQTSQFGGNNFGDFFSQSTNKSDFSNEWGNTESLPQKAQSQPEPQKIQQQDTKKEIINQSPQKSNQKINEIQEIVDQALKEFSLRSLSKGVEHMNRSFEKLNEYIGDNQDKLKKIQKFIIHCATYRFAFQLLIGIKQMHDSNNKKKEMYLYLILIHLNLKPIHRVTLIIECIRKCIEFQNTQLADHLTQQLAQSIDRIPIEKEQLANFKDMQKKLSEITEKQNASLMRMTCPYCQKHFHYKGIKKCSKCNREFSLCSLTLSCIPKDKRLQCKSCESSFSIGSKKAQDQCPICKLSVLV